MPRKRPTESSWDSDEELLGDTSSVSAFSSKKGGDDDIDEDALLGIGDDGMQEYSEGQEYSFTTSEIDIGLDTSVGLDGTADSQFLVPGKDKKHNNAELDYEDIPEETAEEFILEENTDIEDPLMVDEQPNQTTCTVQNTQPSAEGEDDNDSDDDDDKRDRGRFQTERNTTSSVPSCKHTSSIPDSLEITKEMQEEIDTFEKQKGQKGKFNNRRGGGRGQQQNNRGRGGQMRGGQIMQQRMQGPGIRQMGPHGGSPNRMRGPGPHGFQQRPMGQPMRPNSGGGRPQLFTQRGRAMNQAMNRGPVPRFPHEMVRPSNHDNQPRQPTPQQFMSSQPMQIQPLYTEQHQFSHAQHPQPVHTYPGHSQPQPIHPQHTQHTQQSLLQSPQPSHSLPSQQPTVSTIHVNPKFHGGLPPTSVHQHSSQQGLLPQPLYSHHQPAQNYPDSQQAWGHQQHHGQPVSPAPGSYPPSLQLYPPQPQPLLPDPQNRAANPTTLMPPPGHHQQQSHNNMNPHNSHQMQPRPLLQPHQHRPNQPQHTQHVRHIGPGNTPRNPHPGPHQIRPQRPLANQNMRGPRPANQMSGNVRAVRPTGGQQFKQRNPQGNQRMKTPQQGGQPAQPQGFNPPPNQIAAVKAEIDPEKERKMKEMEEKKRLRAERFKSNTPVEVHEGSPSNKKVIATKRTSGEDPADDGVSPAKTIKIETLANMKPDPSAVNSDAGLSKALEEQKKRRELIMKIKEAKRQATAEQKRKALALEQKAATAGKPTDNQPMEVQQVNQQQQQQQQAHRGRGRGQNFNRGQGHANMGGQGRGQPISVLGQKQNNLVQIQTSDQTGDGGFNQGQGHTRGRGQHRGQGQGQRGIIMNRGRGRGVQSSPNVVNLQQVNIQDNAVNVNVVNRTLHEPSNNRTVLTSSATRQVVGMNPRGAASQFSPGRKVIDKSDDGTAPRRIVVNSLDTNQSSTVLIKDLPAKVDLGKVNKKCAQHGNIKSFNYRADAKQIVVQYSSPSEAASFIQKNPKFMIDMGYLTASSIPDGSV